MGGRGRGSQCLGQATDCHRHRHAQSPNFLPTLRDVMIDGTHRLSGPDGGVHPPPLTHPVVLTSGLSVGLNLNNTQRLHLGFDLSVLSGLNGFVDSRVMGAVYSLHPQDQTGQVEGRKTWQWKGH